MQPDDQPPVQPDIASCPAEIPELAPPTATQTWLLLEQVAASGRATWREHVLARITMPFSRFHALASIASGPKSNGQLAGALGVDAAAASTSASELVRLGLARRTPDPADRRRRVTALTAAGEAAMADVTRDGPHFTALDALTAQERQTLYTLLEKVAEQHPSVEPKSE